MKERPILLNGSMVRPTLDGRKTQIRRLMKPQPVAENISGIPCRVHRSCPYGTVGDRLWVRETWSDYWMREDTYDTRLQCVHYRASWDGSLADDPPWKPSIYMPRWASRITLEITGVRVERVQDISEEDAKAEGCELSCMSPTGDDSGSWIGGPYGFATLWDSIYAESGAGWEANPYVWVIEFRRIS